MAVVEMELDVPDEVRIRGYERIADGHAFEVDWPLPDEVTCDKDGCCQPAQIRWGNKIHVIGDLDIQEHLKVFAAYDEPQSSILAYLDERRTSGPVEGLNNKARVITKRCYGVRNTDFVEPTLPRCEFRRTRRLTETRHASGG